MNCRLCGNELDKDSKFCQVCGCTVEQQPIINRNQINKNMANGKAVQQRSNNQGVRRNYQSRPIAKAEYSASPTPKKSNKTIIALIAVITVLLVGLAGAVGYILNNRDEKVNDHRLIGGKDTKVEEMDIESPKPTAMPKPTATQPPTPTSKLVANPKYEIMENSAWDYYCAVPDHFEETTGPESNAYYLTDGTAEMSVGAKNNYSKLSVQGALDKYIGETGGAVTYSATGDDWYAVSVTKDGMVYYRKCFVDEYIRAFSFKFPEEYLDIYDDYIEYIEDNFKRTDV